jgi:hypothetical protein
MPTMYPTPLPEAVIRDGAREAERRVYDALGSHLGPSHSVFYSVAWLSKAPRAAARDGEADFVVVHPERGALLLEVKGGRVGRDGASGKWRSIDHFGRIHPIHDPFAQVKASKHALLHKLQEHPCVVFAAVPLWTDGRISVLAAADSETGRSLWPTCRSGVQRRNERAGLTEERSYDVRPWIPAEGELVVVL